MLTFRRAPGKSSCVILFRIVFRPVTDTARFRALVEESLRFEACYRRKWHLAGSVYSLRRLLMHLSGELTD